MTDMNARQPRLGAAQRVALEVLDEEKGRLVKRSVLGSRVKRRRGDVNPTDHSACRATGARHGWALAKHGLAEAVGWDFRITRAGRAWLRRNGGGGKAQ